MDTPSEYGLQERKHHPDKVTQAEIMVSNTSRTPEERTGPIILAFQRSLRHCQHNSDGALHDCTHHIISNRFSGDGRGKILAHAL